jgi:hypothetical protein
MTLALLVVLAVALIASVFALAREMRLRKALEKLLRMILSKWRAHVTRTERKSVDFIEHSVDPDKRL